MKTHRKLTKLLLSTLFLSAILLFPLSAEEEPIDTAPEATPVFAEEKSSPVPLSELVGRVLIYIGLLGAVGYAVLTLSRRGRLFSPLKNSQSALNVTDTHMLGNKQFLVVVEYESKKILLGVGPGMIQKLSDLPSSTKITPPPPESVLKT